MQYIQTILVGRYHVCVCVFLGMDKKENLSYNR